MCVNALTGALVVSSSLSPLSDGAARAGRVGGQGVIGIGVGVRRLGATVVTVKA